MKTKLIKYLAAVPLAAAVSMIYAESASATFKIRLTDTGTGTVKESSSSDGTLSFTDSVGNFGFNVDAATSKPVTGTADTPLIDLISLNSTSNPAGGTLKIELTDTGFTGAGTFPFKTTVASSGQDQSGVIFNFETYVGAGEFDTSGTQISDFNNLKFDNDGFDLVATKDATTGSPYSVTMVGLLTFENANTASFDATVTKVPEPFTIMGSLAALGFGVYSKRKFKSASEK